MGSSGGGSSKPPNQPTPSGQITGYGSASPFNPQFNSVLSNGMGWADVDEIDAANDRNFIAGPQAAPQQQNMPPMNEAMLRQMLAQYMNPPKTQAQLLQEQTMARRSAQYGGRGSNIAQGGASYTGSSPMRR